MDPIVTERVGRVQNELCDVTLKSGPCRAEFSGEMIKEFKFILLSRMDKAICTDDLATPGVVVCIKFSRIIPVSLPDGLTYRKKYIRHNEWK